MKLYGITVEENRLAEGLYQMMTEQELTVLSFGMLPAPLMSALEKGLGDQFDALVETWLDMTLEEVAEVEQELKSVMPEIDRGCISQDVAAARKKFVSQVEHEVSVSIYRLHAQAGRMVV
jgi:polyhydroxyalkanoate synthesis regulator protein